MLTVGIGALVGSGKVGEGPNDAVSGSLALSTPKKRAAPIATTTTTRARTRKPISFFIVSSLDRHLPRG
jgi:hypothetical protein